MHFGGSPSTRLAICLALGALGCTKSGQTGSPAGDPPSYETPGRWSTEEPGGGTGNPGGETDSNRPTYSRDGGDFGGLLDDDHVVLAVAGRGVLVFDVSDASAPSLVGELSIVGRPFQFELDAGARTAALVVDERTPNVSDDIPAEAPTSRTRLIQVDLDDPAHPRRVAHIDLDADFWQLMHRGDRYFVLGELYQPLAPLQCGEQYWSESGPATRALRVTSYALGADGWSEQESVELPSDSSHAWVTADAVFAVDHFYRASQTQDHATQHLGFVDFGSGSLREGAQVVIDGTPRAVDRLGDTVVVMLERGDGNALQTIALSGASATPQAELVLPPELQQPQSLELIDDGARLLLGGGLAAAIVDLSTPASPRIAQRFPSDVQRVLPVAEGLLGIGASAEPSTQGRLVVTLWDAAGEGEPQSLGRVLTDWPGTIYYDPGREGYTLEAERNLLLLPIQAGNIQPGLGVVTWDASGVRVHSAQPTRGYVYRPFSNGSSAFVPGWDGFEVLPLEEGAAPDEPVSAYVSFREAAALAELDARGFRLALRERAEDGRFVLDVTPSDAPDAEPQRFVLEHRADALVALGERVLALGLRWDGECEFLMQPNPDPNGGHFDACDPARARGLSVIAFDPEPRVVESLAIDSDMDAPVLTDVSAHSTWSGYVQLEDGRIAFPVEQSLQCSSQAGCDALHVQAYESRAAPGCNPQTQDCSMLPREEILTTGNKTNLLLYVLEDADGDAPELTLAGEIEGRFQLPGEGPLDVGWQLLRHGDDLGFAREEPLYNDEGNSIANAHGDAVVRFWLDRIVLRDDGSFEPQPSVNTPGRPLAWIGDDVYTAEPSYTDDDEVLVRLHRARLKDGGAFIEESTDIGQGFLDARVLDDQLFVLRGPADPCADDPIAELFAIDLGSETLEAGDALELPGRYWAFPYGPAIDEDGALLVRGGPGLSGHVRIDVSDPAQPELLGYSDL